MRVVDWDGVKPNLADDFVAYRMVASSSGGTGRAFQIETLTRILEPLADVVSHPSRW
jgi:hypothetical protein